MADARRELSDWLEGVLAALSHPQPPMAEGDADTELRAEWDEVARWAEGLDAHLRRGQDLRHSLDSDPFGDCDTNPIPWLPPTWEPDHDADAAMQRDEIAAGLQVLRASVSPEVFAQALGHLPGTFVDLTDLTAPLTLKPEDTASLLEHHARPTGTAIDCPAPRAPEAPGRWPMVELLAVAAVAVVGLIWTAPAQTTEQVVVPVSPPTPLPVHANDIVTCPAVADGDTALAQPAATQVVTVPLTPVTPTRRRLSSAPFVSKTDEVFVDTDGPDDYVVSVRKATAQDAEPQGRVRKHRIAAEAWSGYGVVVPVDTPGRIADPRFRVVLELGEE